MEPSNNLDLFFHYQVDQSHETYHPEEYLHYQGKSYNIDFIQTKTDKISEEQITKQLQKEVVKEAIIETIIEVKKYLVL